MIDIPNKVFRFPTYNISLGDAIVIVKRHLDNPDVAHQSKIFALEKIANMETHNSITKQDLVNALRWLFSLYDFDGGV